MSEIGLGATVVGDAPLAVDCYRLLLPCARWCGGDGGGAPFATGSTEYQLGRLAQTFGDHPLAAGHFAGGGAADDRFGARAYAALGRLGLAQCLSATAPARSTPPTPSTPSTPSTRGAPVA